MQNAESCQQGKKTQGWWQWLKNAAAGVWQWATEGLRAKRRASAQDHKGPPQVAALCYRARRARDRREKRNEKKVRARAVGPKGPTTGGARGKQKDAGRARPVQIPGQNGEHWPQAVPGDGNCFYHSVLRAGWQKGLFGPEMDPDALRIGVANSAEAVMAGWTPLQQLEVAEAALGGVGARGFAPPIYWGGTDAAAVVSVAFNVAVEVYAHNTPGYADGERVDDQIDGMSTEQVGEGRTIRLRWTCGNHFEWLHTLPSADESNWKRGKGPDGSAAEKAEPASQQQPTGPAATNLKQKKKMEKEKMEKEKRTGGKEKNGEGIPKARNATGSKRDQ